MEIRVTDLRSSMICMAPTPFNYKSNSSVIFFEKFSTFTICIKQP